jgi:hypothetical protein
MCIYNSERTLQLYLSAVTDIDIITPLSYPLKWYWSRDYVDVTIHNTEQDFLMFKYMINIIWYGSFRITSRINPRPISSLELKLSGWYWCLGLIRDVIRKALGMILIEGWYGMWYGKSHIIFSIYHLKNSIFLFSNEKQ